MDPRSMAQLSPQKRKKRRLQLREAQRRRRARLKEESKSFLQIILSQRTLRALKIHSETIGKPLHATAAQLIEVALGVQATGSMETEKRSASATVVPERDEPVAAPTHSIQPSTVSGHELEPQSRKAAGQMDLFVG
jgi:hypothetical protein